MGKVDEVYKAEVMIIKRKLFGLFGNLWRRKSIKENHQLTIEPKTFKELYDMDPWPALVVIGIKEDSTKELNGWPEFFEALRDKFEFFENPRDVELIGIHPLSDNVKGKNGSSATCLVFSPKTKISSYKRLVYGQNFKWPEDFFYNFKSWYTSGKLIR